MIGLRPSIISLAVRVLVRDGEDRLARIVHIDSSLDEIWLKNLDDRTWPFRLSCSEFVADYERPSPRYEIAFDEPRPLYVRPPNSDTATDERQKEHWDIIECLLAGAEHDERALFFPITRRRLVTVACEQFNVTRQTVVNILMRYWQRGMTFDSLRPDFRECGAPGVPRNIVSGTKAGRPRTISPDDGVSTNDDLRRIFQIAADYYFASRRRRKMQDAVDYIVRKFFCHQIKGLEGGQVEVEVATDKPTVRQLRHYIKTHYRPSVRYRAREGEKKWLLEGRAILGQGDHGTQGPGDKYQVDATVADIYLVSQYDRRRIVRRPVIYFVIDVWSRLIVGIYVGFEGPSWAGAMMALINMVTPKVEFCKQYEIGIDFDDWPSHHPPKALLADRGELSSVGLTEPIERSLRIKIENAGPGRADLKALVERRFGIVPAVFKPFTPGYVEADFGERGVRDCRLDAKLHLFEFTQVLLLSVIEHNNHPVSGLRAPPGMITEGREPTPVELYKWGIENRSGALRHLTIDEVALAVMPRGKARVTAKGIRFKKAYYECDTAHREEWFSEARKAEWNVDVSFDLRAKEVLYLRSEKLRQGYEICRLLPGSSRDAGKSHYEADELDHAQKALLAATADKRQAARIETDIMIERIVKKASDAAMAVKDASRSMSEQLSSIRENSADEKSARRREEAVDLTPILRPKSEASQESKDDDAASEQLSYEDQSLEFLEQLKPGGDE
ncbi:hypothetical protein [Bradyrhizobium embrapense]